MGLRGLLLCCGLAYFLSLTPSHSQSLWPGAPAAQAWVQFSNGAWGIVTDMATTLDGVTDWEVEFWDDATGQSRRTWFSDLDGNNGNPRWQGSNGPRVQPSKWSRWAPWARAAGRGVGFGSSILAAVYPDELGDGSFDAHCQGNSVCEQTGYPPCQNIGGCSPGAAAGSINWTNVPCLRNNTNTLMLDDGVDGSGSTFCPMSYYPDEPPQPHFWTFLTTSQMSQWPDLWDTLPLPDDLTPEQEELLNVGDAGTDRQLGVPGPWNPGGGTLPDVWENLPMPPGTEGQSARQMNPGGYAPNGEGIVRDPSPTPSIVEWPQIGDGGDAWPEDHGAPVQEVAPDGSVITSPAGEPPDIELTVEFPDTMDVEVQNWPETPITEIDAELEIREIDFGSLTWAGGWLPDTCPDDLEMALFGDTIAMPYEPVCQVAAGIANVLIGLTLVTGSLFVLRGL
jgi:hypothetical protein